MRAYFLSFCCLVNWQFIFTTTNSITLIPLNNNIDGIEVASNENNHNVIITPNQWNINVSNTNGWDLHISMNNSWKFLSDKETTLTLKVYSESITNTQHKNIIFILSQNNQKYLSSTIDISTNSSNNDIYPHCNSINNEQQSLLAKGNINSLLTKHLNDIETREYKLSNGSNYESINANVNNHFPLIIQLINNPINKWSKYKYSNEECEFEPFSTDYPIDIFISASDIGQILSINKIEISLSYKQTDGTDVENIDTDENNRTTYVKSGIELFIDKNHKIIVFTLISITSFLFLICNILMGMLIKLSIDNRRLQSTNANNTSNMENEDIIASEMSDCNDDFIGIV